MQKNRFANARGRAARAADLMLRVCQQLRRRMPPLPSVYWGRYPSAVTGPAIILFPCSTRQLCCGLAGLIAVKGKSDRDAAVDLPALGKLVDAVETAGLTSRPVPPQTLQDSYLGGADTLEHLLTAVRVFKQEPAFLDLYKDETAKQTLMDLAGRLSTVLQREQEQLANQAGSLETQAVDMISTRIDALKDIIWTINVELAGNLSRIKALMGEDAGQRSDTCITVFRQINAVLNSIDRLEVRGRDSAGISILFIFPQSDYDALATALDKSGLTEDFQARMNHDVLGNTSISMNPSTSKDGEPIVALTMVYKIAAEIGSPGRQYPVFARADHRGCHFAAGRFHAPLVSHGIFPYPLGIHWCHYRTQLPPGGQYHGRRHLERPPHYSRLPER